MTDEVGYFRTDEAAEIDPSGRPRYLVVEQDLPGLNVEPGLVLRPVFGQNMTLSFVFMQPHSIAPVHQHAQEQIGTIIEGSYEFELDGVKRVVRKGDVYVVPPNVPHGAVTHDESCLALDVFSPPRDAFAELMAQARSELGAHEETGDWVWTPPGLRSNQPGRGDGGEG